MKNRSILIFGDLHISDVFSGKHKNYLSNCFSVLGKMDAIVEKEEPEIIVLLGDLVGWSETNIRSREVLGFLCKLIRKWGEKSKIYAVKGNHDIKGYPEFLLLHDLGFITTSADCNGYFDFVCDGNTEVRFHIVDYKEESRHLDIHDGDNTSNIVLGHNNYTVSGLTNWYQEHDGIELGYLQNFSGVDFVISGHIHNPSPEIISATMPDGGTCSLLYPGCPTRPIKDKNIYDDCSVVKIWYNAEKKTTELDTLSFGLDPASEIFYADEEFIEEKTEEEIADAERKEALMDVLGDLLKYRMNQGDPISQVDNIPNASPEAKEIAKSYLLKALNNGV